ncbi:MAG TPA: hypothetical protein DEP57_00020 [Selenomonas sp.]|nr:hypothetical protein [Selenomonas sp.]
MMADDIRTNNSPHRRIPVGVDDFKQLREECYFVDKTRFIKELVDERSKVTLITRPRRFGKTLTMSMLYYFFTNENAEENRKLFAETDIDACGDRYMAEQGQRPVIFVTLNDAKKTDMPSMLERMGRIMARTYAQFPYLDSDSSPLNQADRDYYKRIHEMKGSQDDVEDSLRSLSYCLHKYHGRKAVILLDEYDVPIQQGWQYHFHEEAVTFMRNFMGATFKSNDALDFGIITGVLRIAKETIFSSLNNLEISSVVQGRFADIMGFTENEVRTMAESLGRADRMGEIKHWYDGYAFSNQDIYNPWSVINYFQQGCQPQVFWLNTSGNAIIGEMMEHADASDEEKLLSLLRGEPVDAVVDEAVVYSDIYTNKDALYTMLLTAGYLKAIENRLDDGEHICTLAIPNREIATVYRKEVVNRYRGRMSRTDLRTVLMSIAKGDVEKFSAGLQKYLEQIASFHDTANKESFYHGFLLGLTAWFMPKYRVKSNRESGYGRFDLGIFPNEPGQAGVVMEFKVAGSEESMKKEADAALAQIEQMDYLAEFREQGITSVWKYGIAFYGKKLKITRGDSNDIAMAALNAMREISEASKWNGLSDMTIDEINAEIAATRCEMEEHKKHQKGGNEGGSLK